MSGFKRLHVIIDASGSFHELGKQKMLEYLVNSIRSAASMPWFETELHLYTWRETVDEIQTDSSLAGSGVASIAKLYEFLQSIPEADGVMLISDGLFERINNRAMLRLTKDMKWRLQIIAAGYNANVTTLKRFSSNIHLAEDIIAVLRYMTAGVLQ